MIEMVFTVYSRGKTRKLAHEDLKQKSIGNAKLKFQPFLLKIISLLFRKFSVIISF